MKDVCHSINIRAFPSCATMFLDTLGFHTTGLMPGHPNVRGPKEARGNLFMIAKTALLCGEGFHIYFGNDDQTVPINTLGGKGVLSVLANVMRMRTHKTRRLFLNGDLACGSILQLKFLDMTNALFCDVNPTPCEGSSLHYGDLRRKLTSPTDIYERRPKGKSYSCPEAPWSETG